MRLQCTFVDSDYIRTNAVLRPEQMVYCQEYSAFKSSLNKVRANWLGVVYALKEQIKFNIYNKTPFPLYAVT